jgi:DNA-binding beta-propeller fold protein YncE
MRYIKLARPLQVALLLVGALDLAPMGVARAQGNVPQYKVTDSILVGRTAGDYYAFDAIHRRIYGAGPFVVSVDTRAVTQLPDTNAGGGFIIAPEFGRGLVRDGEFFDLASGKVLKRVAAEGDAVAYEPRTGRGFLLLDTVSVVDMKTGALVGRIPTSGPVVAGIADGKGHLFVTLSGPKGKIILVDARTLAIVDSFPVPVPYPKSLAIDMAHNRLFVDCEDTVAVLAIDRHRFVATIPAPGQPPMSAFDGATGLLFEPGGDTPNGEIRGLTIIHEDTPDHYTVVQTIKDPRVASHRVIVDGKTHRIYMPHQTTDSTFAFVILASNGNEMSRPVPQK